jgi:hypothetical protein
LVDTIQHNEVLGGADLQHAVWLKFNFNITFNHCAIKICVAKLQIDVDIKLVPDE